MMLSLSPVVGAAEMATFMAAHSGHAGFALRLLTRQVEAAEPLPG